MGLDFLEYHKCDPMFLKKKTLICDTVSVPLYHKKFELPYNKVFRVVPQDTISIPSGHTVVVSTFIPDRKRPPIALAALFEPNGRFNGDKALTAPVILFNYSEDVIPVVIENSGDEPVTLYKDTTLGTSEIVPKKHIQNVGVYKPKDKPPTKYNRTDENYNLTHVKTAVNNQLSSSLQDEFGSLIDDFSDVFSKNEWDVGKWSTYIPIPGLLNCRTEGCHFISRKISEKNLMPFCKKTWLHLAIARIAHLLCWSRRRMVNSDW